MRRSKKEVRTAEEQRRIEKSWEEMTRVETSCEEVRGI